MGQSSSRPHEPSARPALPTPSTLTNAVAGASTDAQPVLSADVDAHASDSSGSQRSPIRKSILKLVKPSNIRSRLSSVASHPGEVGRSWRNSRRWSKSPHNSTTPPLEPQLASSSTSFTDAPSNLLPPALDKGKQREITPPSDEEEDSQETTHINVDQASRLASGAPLPDLTASAMTPVLGATDSVVGSLADPHTVSETTDDAHTPNEADFESSPIESPSPVNQPEGNQAPSSPEPQLPPSPPQSTPPPRQFPPPGTLVVVQGIVHTTDVTRPGSTSQGESTPSSNSRPGSGLETLPDQSANRTRNRLSALLRPRSASSRPPSTLVGESTSTTTAPPEAEHLPASASELSRLSTAESTQNDVNTAVPNEPVDLHRDEFVSLTGGSPPASDSRVPSISSSSIDVLGTLLSVAAAATAASLLTGSSEPILSSGLAPPNPSSFSPSSASPISTTSPSTTSLPNLPPYPRSPTPNTMNPDISAAGRAERMRQAWGTIRERLGLRPSVSPPGHAPGDVFRQDNNLPSPIGLNGDAATTGTPTDTRELMLAEMARAFNIGLGLNGLGGLTQTASTSNAPADRDAVGVPRSSPDEDHMTAEGTGNDTASQPRSAPATNATNMTMPPEGSFERFLVDLQIDLRAALTQADENAETTQASTQNPQSPEQGTPIFPVAANDATAPSTSSLPVFTEFHEQQTASQLDVHAEQSGNTEAVHTGDDFYADLPLQELSDSESEFDEDDHEDDDDDDFHSVEHESTDAGQNGPSNDETHPRTSGTGRIDASGRINWWRLYRFPPIISPRIDTAGLRQPFVATPQSTSPTTTPTSLFSPNPTPHPAGPSPTDAIPIDSPSSDTPTSNSLPLPQQPHAQALHSVVPVIVVGLQSVNQEWRPEMPQHGENEGIDFFGRPSSEEGNANGPANDHVDEDDLDAWGGQHSVGLDGARGRGRARGWQSRAANAIRNLRSGRRNTEAGTGAQAPLVAPGSRTFLIYVIGGYYPPDHSIVTGGPNILDSFEALLELADLLGQVKPPTVSKDDIDKSGLKIIKASELVQHEKEGKVSANCLDRCLICLDDYEPDDQIRVMSCRHAFHKGCVDEWLQKGRNNCPACRSTGVKADTHASPVTPMPAS
ncbi:hypothetical protein GALMADRAFT_251097 [Galerina marginata CBS 339.88]|uniref:RING-type domain-containing protein n=1 Tax=Galerina marginata (strain CBS 339.88) TaxID=685588 RepID=A0A067SRG9_GALM3|nr:hypothetical protein GALMADRAFT_251097 [Galerina marginata CBS 339.88]